MNASMAHSSLLSSDTVIVPQVNPPLSGHSYTPSAGVNPSPGAGQGLQGGLRLAERLNSQEKAVFGRKCWAPEDTKSRIFSLAVTEDSTVLSQGWLSVLPSWVMLCPVMCVLQGQLWVQPSPKRPQREGRQLCRHRDTTLPGTWSTFSVLQGSWRGSSAHSAWQGHLSP